MLWFNKKKSKKLPRNLNDVTELFANTYRYYQEQDPDLYNLDLNKKINKEVMIEFFREQEWIMQVAYNNTMKGERLNKGRIKINKSSGSAIPAKDLLDSAMAYSRAIEILEQS